MALLFTMAERHNVDVVCLQETWHDARTQALPPPDLPNGWICIFSDLDEYTKNVRRQGAKGRGLAVLARRTALHGIAPSGAIHRRAHIHNAHYQLLVVTLGRAFIASAYVDCRAPAPRVFDELVADLANVCASQPDFAIILAGDFNHPRHHQALWTAVAIQLQARPLLPAGTVTFPSSGTALDNIFYRPGLHQPEWNVLPTEDVGGLSDHLVIIGRFSRMAFGVTNQEPPTSQDRICWHRLRPPLVNPDAPAGAVAAAKAAHSARLAAIKTAIGRVAPTVTDLADLNDHLLAIARRELGTRPVYERTNANWLWCRHARDALAAFRVAYRAWRARRSPGRKRRLNQAQRALTKAKQRALTFHDLQVIKRISANLNPTDFFKAYRARREPKACTAGASLDPAEAVPFWAGLFTRDPAYDANPIADWEPLGDAGTLELSPSIVTMALCKTKTSGAVGPDGLAVCFLKAFADTLLPLLHRLFQVALRQGLPAALKQGRTVLIPKPAPASPAGTKERPITVLPVATRVFHKALDLMLREFVYEQGIISPNQSGFMPHRSTYDQGLVLSTLAAACPRLPTRAPLITVFLDIEKAYDSIGHEDLLEVMATLGIPAAWREAVRLLLLDNTTTILGHRVPVTRGCPQGSPISPLLCLFMMEGLHRHIRATFPAGPAHFPLKDTAVPAALTQANWALLSHQIFADDNALTTPAVATAQELADCCGAWLTQHHLRASPKSTAVILAAPCRSAIRPTTAPHIARVAAGDMDVLPAPLRIQEVTLPWMPQEKYLGMRFAAQPAGRTRFDRAAPDGGKLQQRAHRFNTLRLLFTPRGRAPLVHARHMVLGLKQVILADSLYPTPVMDVDFAQLDGELFKFARRILRLAPTYHSALLWHELNLWPTRYYSDLRVLRYARNFKTHWLYRELLRALEDHAHGEPSILSQPGGALTRLLATLDSYKVDLGDIDPGDKEGWGLTAKGLISTTLAEVFHTTFATYPASHQRHLRLVLDLTDRDRPRVPAEYPTYIKLGGVWAAIGLRAKAYSLRFIQGQRRENDRPACDYCREPHAECGAHLIDCPRLPGRYKEEVDTVLFAIFHQATKTRPAPMASGERPRLQGPPRDLALQYIRRLEWPHARRRTVVDALLLYGAIINSYRARIPAHLPAGAPNPIYAVNTSPFRNRTG